MDQEQLVLKIEDLVVNVGETPILKGVNLEVRTGEVAAIMGPNGSGKSTLSRVLAGHPDYEVISGSIHYLGRDILSLDVQDRALAGIFMGFQYPVEIPGVNNAAFLKMALNAKRKHCGESELDAFDFDALLNQKMKSLKMDPSFKERMLNSGFSGGEKKRNEILQMAILEPRLAVLDETDSGLDIDALKIVSEGINALRSGERGMLLITHYQRLLDYVKPDRIHVMAEGQITRSGGPDLALELEERGYELNPA